MLTFSVALLNNCSTTYRQGKNTIRKVYVCPADMQCFVDKAEKPYLNKCKFNTTYDTCEAMCKGECMLGKNGSVQNVTQVWETKNKEDTLIEHSAWTVTLQYYYCRYEKMRIWDAAPWTIGVTIGFVCLAALFVWGVMTLIQYQEKEEVKARAR